MNIPPNSWIYIFLMIYKVSDFTNKNTHTYRRKVRISVNYVLNLDRPIIWILTGWFKSRISAALLSTSWPCQGPISKSERFVGAFSLFWLLNLNDLLGLCLNLVGLDQRPGRREWHLLMRHCVSCRLHGGRN